MLLAAFGERRPTRDVDLLARATDNDVGTVAALVRDVLSVEVDDGIVFDPAGLTARVIRSDERYAGVRIVVPARLDISGSYDPQEAWDHWGSNASFEAISIRVPIPYTDWCRSRCAWPRRAGRL